MAQRNAALLPGIAQHQRVGVDRVAQHLHRHLLGIEGADQRVADAGAHGGLAVAAGELPVGVLHEGRGRRAVGVERDVGAALLHHRQRVLGGADDASRRRSPGRPARCRPWWCGSSSARLAICTWLQVAPPFCARPPASCVTTPLPSMCAAMPSSWPMVMTPVPPTPPTTMPQALSRPAAASGSGSGGSADRSPRCSFFGFFSCPPSTVTKLGQKPLTQRVVQVAGALVDAPLAAELGFHRLDRQAVALHRAVAAAFAHQLVDDHALVRRGQLAALAAAALLGGAGLVVDDRRWCPASRATRAGCGRARRGGAPSTPASSATPWYFSGWSVTMTSFFTPSATRLFMDLQHRVALGPLADLLAAGHRHRVVVEHLVGDVHARGDALADGQQAAVEVGAVAEVGEDVLVVRERRLADPGHALAAHLREGAGAAVHPHRHVVAADAGHRARAFGHARAGVVRAAAAEPGRALAGVGLQLGELALARRR